MKCHICGKEMRVTSRKWLYRNDVGSTVVEEWCCDDCDRWWKRLRRWLSGQ